MKKKHLWHEKQKDKNTKMGQFCVSIWLGYSTPLLNQKLDAALKVFCK